MTAQPFSIDSHRQRVSIPFELINNLIVVEAVLNNKQSVKLILDTGVRNTILTDRMGMFQPTEESQRVQVSGLGERRDINAYLAENISLSIHGITGKGLTMVVLEEDYLQLSSHLGTEVHGILGYDFFSSFTVNINYTSNRITVFNPGRYKPGRRYQAFPVRIEQGRPYLEAKFTQYGHEPISASFLLDTGASHGLLLEKTADEKVVLPDNTLRTVIGWGLGGEVQGHLGRIEKLEINGFNFNDMLVSFAENYSDPRMFDMFGRRGSIGGELLGRFSITFDYAAEKLYLRRNYHYNRHFEFNLSGIDLVAGGKDFKRFRVINVISGSPAAEAGVMENDLLIRINGRYAGQLSLSEINSMLRSREGRRVEMIVYRNGEFLQFRFRLRRMV